MEIENFTTILYVLEGDQSECDRKELFVGKSCSHFFYWHDIRNEKKWNDFPRGRHLPHLSFVDFVDSSWQTVFVQFKCDCDLKSSNSLHVCLSLSLCLTHFRNLEIFFLSLFLGDLMFELWKILSVFACLVGGFSAHKLKETNWFQLFFPVRKKKRFSSFYLRRIKEINHTQREQAPKINLQSSNLTSVFFIHPCSIGWSCCLFLYSLLRASFSLLFWVIVPAVAAIV